MEIVVVVLLAAGIVLNSATLVALTRDVRELQGRGRPEPLTQTWRRKVVEPAARRRTARRATRAAAVR